MVNAPNQNREGNPPEVRKLAFMPSRSEEENRENTIKKLISILRQALELPTLFQQPDCASAVDSIITSIDQLQSRSYKYTLTADSAFPYPSRENKIMITKILTWNIRAFRSNSPDLFQLANNEQIDIIALSETWIKPGMVVSSPGYKS